MDTERGFVQRLFVTPRLRAKYRDVLKSDYFTDIDARLDFQRMVDGAPIAKLRFEVDPLHEDELDNAVDVIQKEHFFQESLRYSRQVEELAREGHMELLEERLAAPPMITDPRQDGSMKAHAAYFLKLLMAEGQAVRVKSPFLEPLNIWQTRGQIIVVGGSTGDGKSLLGEQILLDYSSQGHYCLEISVELGLDEKIFRYIQHLEGETTSYSALANGYIDHVRATTGYNKLQTLPDGKPRQLHVLAGLTDISEVEAAINAQYLKFLEYRTYMKSLGFAYDEPMIVMVDFMQAMTANGITQDEFTKVSYTAERLYVLAKKLDITLIEMAQLNKPSPDAYKFKTLEERLPTKHAIQFGNKLDHYSNRQYLIYTDLSKNMVGPGKQPVYVNITKNRGGNLGAVSGIRNGPELRFEFDKVKV